MLTNKRAKRKVTGGRYKHVLKKEVNKASLATHTKLEERKVKISRSRSGEKKLRLLSENKVNVFDSKSKKSNVVKITNVVETPSNRHLVRRNIITKGAIVETEIGKVKITSRPGQEGTLNGILIK